MKFMRFAFLFLIGTAFTFVPADTKLEYQFKPGDVYEIQQESTQTIKQTVPGMGEMVIDNKVSGSMLLKVLEKTATGSKAEFTFTKVKMAMKSMQGEVILDSEGDQTNQMNKVMTALTNKGIIIFLSKNGTIEKVENADKISASINEMGLDAATMDVAKQSLSQYLNADALKSTIEATIVQYPSTGKAAVGGTWKTTTNSPSVIPMRFDNAWTLSKVEGEVGFITNDATVSSVDKEKILTLSGFKAKADLSGQQASKSKIDIKTGWPTELKSMAVYSGVITLLAGGQIPEDMAIPMETSAETTYTIVKK
jgi:Family of unknown function (DUF6263)